MALAANASSPSSELTPLKFGGPSGFKDALLLSQSYKLIEESLFQLGYAIELIEMPGRRTLAETSQGMLDADISRVPSVAENIPNLIKVTEPFVIPCFAGYQIGNNINEKSAIDINSNWETEAAPLATTKHLIHITNEVKERWPEVEFVTVEDAQQAIKMLTAGRIKTIILPSGMIKSIEASIIGSRFAPTNLTQVTPILYSFDTYVYFNQKHKKLAIDLAAKLKQLRPKFLPNPCDF